MVTLLSYFIITYDRHTHTHTIRPLYDDGLQQGSVLLLVPTLFRFISLPVPRLIPCHMLSDSFTISWLVTGC